MKTFAAALLTVGALSTQIYTDTVDHLGYYKDKVTRSSSPFTFTRLVPVRTVTKYFHAHSDASDSSDVDSLASEHDSHYSDGCPGRYDCTDASDFSSLHSSDDSDGVSSHDHDHGYYGYDYFFSDTESHSDDLHAHLRVTERHKAVPEVFH